MPHTAVPQSVPSSVGREKLLHTQCEVGARGLDQQVQMVAHEDEGRQFPLTPQHRAPQVVEQSLTVRVVVNDPLAAVAPGHHVIDGALKLDAKSSRHLPSRTHRSEGLNKKNQKQSLTPNLEQKRGTQQKKPKTKSDPQPVKSDPQPMKSDPQPVSQGFFLGKWRVLW